MCKEPMLLYTKNFVGFIGNDKLPYKDSLDKGYKGFIFCPTCNTLVRCTDPAWAYVYINKLYSEVLEDTIEYCDHCKTELIIPIFLKLDQDNLPNSWKKSLNTKYKHELVATIIEKGPQ